MLIRIVHLFRKCVISVRFKFLVEDSSHLQTGFASAAICFLLAVYHFAYLKSVPIVSLKGRFPRSFRYIQGSRVAVSASLLILAIVKTSYDLVPLIFAIPACLVGIISAAVSIISLPEGYIRLATLFCFETIATTLSWYTAVEFDYRTRSYFGSPYGIIAYILGITLHSLTLPV